MSSGTLIREARRRAGLSQTELARRAAVAQSVISAYEADRREPGLGMLTKLIEAAGHELVVDVRPSATLRRGVPDTRLGRRLRRRRRAVIDAATRRGGHNVRVFGSVARGEETDDSDIDLLVDLDSGVGLVGLVGLGRELTELLGADVDVVPGDALKPGLRDGVLAEAIPL
jgi:predicted nucleotidyltransferase/DNA-binding XRE family transcriptional regulator